MPLTRMQDDVVIPMVCGTPSAPVAIHPGCHTHQWYFVCLSGAARCQWSVAQASHGQLPRTSLSSMMLRRVGVRYVLGRCHHPAPRLHLHDMWCSLCSANVCCPLMCMCTTRNGPLPKCAGQFVPRSGLCASNDSLFTHSNPHVSMWLHHLHGKSWTQKGWSE